MRHNSFVRIESIQHYMNCTCYFQTKNICIIANLDLNVEGRDWTEAVFHLNQPASWKCGELLLTDTDKIRWNAPHSMYIAQAPLLDVEVLPYFERFRAGLRKTLFKNLFNSVKWLWDCRPPFWPVSTEGSSQKLNYIKNYWPWHCTFLSQRAQGKCQQLFVYRRQSEILSPKNSVCWPIFCNRIWVCRLLIFLRIGWYLLRLTKRTHVILHSIHKIYKNFRNSVKGDKR